MAVEGETSTIPDVERRYDYRRQQVAELQELVDDLVQRDMDGTEEKLETALAQYLEAAKSGSVRDERDAWDRLTLDRRIWQEDMEMARQIAYDLVVGRPLTTSWAVRNTRTSTAPGKSTEPAG